MNKKSALGILLGFCIGVFCRLSGVPVPAPPVLPGALLVLAMTAGYLLADRVAKRKLTTRHLCAGHAGDALPTPQQATTNPQPQE